MKGENMSRRKTKLQEGKFYYAFGGGKHPSQVYEIDKKHKTYKSIKTGTTQNKDMIPIKSIQKGYKNSFVHKIPFEGTRSDYGDKELVGLSFDSSDYITIEQIKKRKPKRSRRAKERYK